MQKEEFLKNVDLQFSNDDFYFLCKAFMDVGLNSEKIRLNDGTIGAKFSLDDMRIASEKVKEYLQRYSIGEKTLLKAIKIYAYNSIDEGDKRPKFCYDENSSDVSRPHYTGTLYLFTDIPDNVLEQIFDDAKKII